MKICLKNVNKKFKNEEVLKNINVNFESGKIYGLIGRNGSGKSVLLKILCNFYEPTEGKVIYNGKDIVDSNDFPPSTRAQIEAPSFLPELTGLENLELLASIQKKIGKKEIMNALEKVNLIGEENKKYSKYSLGMKQKLGIAQVLMENPEVLILDEPFSGIEEKTVEKLRKILKEEKNKNKLIIIASHIKEDIETLSDEVYKLDEGKMAKIK